MEYNIRTSNNPLHVQLPQVARMKKLRKISKIVLDSFLGIEGESCTNPSYKIPNEINALDRSRIAWNVSHKIAQMLRVNPNIGNNCETINDYIISGYSTRQLLILNFMRTKMSEGVSNTGGKNKKTLKKYKKKKRKGKLKRKSKRKTNKNRK